MKKNRILWIAAGVLLFMLGGCAAGQKDQASAPPSDAPAGSGTTAPGSSLQAEAAAPTMPAMAVSGTPLTEWDAMGTTISLLSGSMVFSVYDGKPCGHTISSAILRRSQPACGRPPAARRKIFP